METNNTNIYDAKIVQLNPTNERISFKFELEDGSKLWKNSNYNTEKSFNHLKKELAKLNIFVKDESDLLNQVSNLFNKWVKIFINKDEANTIIYFHSLTEFNDEEKKDEEEVKETCLEKMMKKTQYLTPKEPATKEDIQNVKEEIQKLTIYVEEMFTQMSRVANAVEKRK